MSDAEDDMDLDGETLRDSEEVKFTSDNANKKGKRSAANLPVEAEDSLPWWVPSNASGTLLIQYRVEKYRPDTLNDVSGHQDILTTINKFIDSNVPLQSHST